MTREELIKKLRALARNNQDLSSDTELLDECRKLGLNDFDTTKPGKIADFLENNPPEPTVENKPATKALNSQDLKVILADYEKYKDSKDVDKIAQKIQENPLLKRADAKEILRIIERRLGLEKENVAGETANKRLVTEERLSEVKPATVTKEEVQTMAEKVVEVAETSETIENSREEIAAVLKETKIKDKKLGEEVIKTTVAETADKIIEENVGKAVEKLTGSLADFKPTVEEINEIETAVREKIETKLEDPTAGLNERKAVQTEENGRIIVKTGKNLTEEVAEVLGDKVGGDKKTQIEVAVKNVEVDLNQNLFIVNQTNGNSPVDVVLREKLKEEIISRMAGSDVKEAEEVAEMIAGLRFPSGESSNSAALVTAMKMLEENGFHGGDNPRSADQAGIIRNLIRSPLRIEESVKGVVGVSGKLKGIKGFEQLDTVAKTLTENPRMMKALQLIQNVTKFQETIGNLVTGITNPVGYIFKIPAVQEFGVQLATRFGGEAIGAMATQITNFGLETGLKNIMGQLLKTGTVTAVKAGTKVMADVAADAAIDGTVDAGLAATGVGVPIALILLVLQLGWELIKPVLNWIKNKFEDFLETIGVGSAKTKVWLQDSFGKLGGSILYWGGMAAAFLLGPMMLFAAGSVAVVAWLVPGVLGGLTVMQMSTAQTVAPMVAPKGLGADTGCRLIGTNGTPGVSNTNNGVYTYTDDNGDTYQCTNAPNNTAGGNYNPNSPPLPGENIPGECNKPASAVVLTKQCDSDWANKRLSGPSCSDGSPGTICNSGCGPTSVSMLLRHINGSYTPDTVIFSPGLPFSGIYNGMGCDGSTLQQGYAALASEFGSKVQYGAGCTPKAIGGWICAGKAVFVLANFYRDGNLDLGGHFILAVAVQNGNIISADPYYPTTTPFDGVQAFGHIHDILGCVTIDLN